MKAITAIALVLGMLLCAETQAQIAPIPLTPNWSRGMPNGPDASVKRGTGISRIVDFGPVGDLGEALAFQQSLAWVVRARDETLA